MKGWTEPVKFTLLLRIIACRKLNIANRRNFVWYVWGQQSSLHQPIVQTKRHSQQSKRKEEQLHIQKLKLIRQQQRKNIPILNVFNGITIGQLANMTQRTPEQVHFVKSIVENVQHKKRERYSLKVPLAESLLVEIIKRLGYRPIIGSTYQKNHQEDKDIYAKPVTSDFSQLKCRSPIVAVMGHVDHGKTTILDTLRKTSIAAAEAGGITQSIGAFSVPLLETGQTVTFLDTPGHSVFTSMRERGAQVTDIVVLVVAADDGVMEQTIESIKMAKRAETSIIVALNKCDKKNSQPEFVIEELATYGIKCEEIGGEIQAVKISALKNMGMDNLVKCIIAQADQLELKCDPTMQSQGVVIESKTEKGRGYTATVVLKQGTLKTGQILVAGTSYAKIRQMWDSNGNRCTKVKPGQAANVMGWKSLPASGQVVLEAENESKAKTAIKQREKELERLESDEAYEELERKRMIQQQEYRKIVKKYTRSIDRVTAGFEMMIKKNKVDDETPTLNIIVKADVDGSMEAILKILNTYDCNENCHLKLAHYGIGDLSSSEYELAQNTDASIFLFNTDVNSSLKNNIDESVPVFKHEVIYHLVDDLIDKINASMPMVEFADVKGEADVLDVFQARKNVIIGCSVKKGALDFSQMHRVIRNDEVIHQGSLESMRHHETSITQAKTGSECGLLFSEISQSGIKIGDIVQCYTSEMKKNKITWRPPGF